MLSDLEVVSNVYCGMWRFIVFFCIFLFIYLFFVLERKENNRSGWRNAQETTNLQRPKHVCRRSVPLDISALRLSRMITCLSSDAQCKAVVNNKLVQYRSSRNSPSCLEVLAGKKPLYHACIIAQHSDVFIVAFFDKAKQRQKRHVKKQDNEERSDDLLPALCPAGGSGKGKAKKHQSPRHERCVAYLQVSAL
jgi:hypothetical protein